MFGPAILVRSLSVPQPRGKSGALWQYNSRSPLHGNVACWGVLFDLMGQSSLLRRHAAERKVVFGLGHEMRDFETGRKKELDLVIARPREPITPSARTFADLASTFHLKLDPVEAAALAALSPIFEGAVGAPLLALEAKAAMTEHNKARPRLYDELNSSHSTVHGASSQALAVGFVMVNASTLFVSSDLNKTPGGEVRLTSHTQPKAAERVIEKVREIPRRSGRSGYGFDGLAVVVVSCTNDGGSVELVSGPPAPPPADVLSYPTMITRVANEYDAAFGAI